MKSEKLIHIKFESESALETKRDILASEIGLLKISKRLKNYLYYRLEELIIKSDLEKKLRSLKLDFGKLQNLLPSVELPSLLKNSQELKEIFIAEKEPDKLVKKVSESDSNLDKQLQEIQNRLSSLQK